MAYPLLTRPFLRLFFGQDDDSSPVILKYEPSRTAYHRSEKADNVWPQTLSLCGPAHLWKTYSVQKRTVDMRAIENQGVAETDLGLVSTLQRVGLPLRDLCPECVISLAINQATTTGARSVQFFSTHGDSPGFAGFYRAL